jgi:hypothetical protein
VFLDDEDEPDDTFLAQLLTAQAASGADVVTAGVRLAGEDDAIQLFLGDPGALGLTENHYGVVGLVRADVLTSAALGESYDDPDWPLFARIALAGCRIVSLPEPLARLAGRPGRINDVPGEGLAVLTAFEEARAHDLRDLPELAATLAAALTRAPSPAGDGVQASAPVKRIGAVVRRARTRFG